MLLQCFKRIILKGLHQAFSSTTVTAYPNLHLSAGDFYLVTSVDQLSHPRYPRDVEVEHVLEVLHLTLVLGRLNLSSQRSCETELH